MPFNWYVIQSKPRQELKACRELSNQGYETFLPVIPVERIARGRRIEKEEVLFPRYLFLRLSPKTSDWTALRSTKGVSRLIRFGAWIPCLTPDELDALKTWINALPQKEPFQVGQVMDVISGPFKGMQVTFERLIQAVNGEERALVLFELLGKVHQTGINIGDLRILA